MNRLRTTTIKGSAEAPPILCVRYFRWERERERERYRERRKWRHQCRAKIGGEFTLSLAKNSHNWRRAYTFPCLKIALFVSPFTLPFSPFTERSPFLRWKSQWVHTHTQARKRFLYCAWGTFGERERERERERDTERDGSDVTNVALKLAVNLHFPLPKIRTIGDELTLSLA